MRAAVPPIIDPEDYERFEGFLDTTLAYFLHPAANVAARSHRRRRTRPIERSGKFIFRPGGLPSREGSLSFGQEAYQVASEADLAVGEAYQATREAYFLARKLTKPREKLNFRLGSLPSRQ